MEYTWNVVTSGNSVDEFENSNTNVSDFNAGDLCLLKVTGLGPLAKTFDGWGFEQTVGRFLVPAHTEIEDCWESGGVGYVRFRVTGTPVHLIIGAIVALLISIGVIVAGIYLYRWGIKVVKKIADFAAWGAIIGGALLLVWPKGEKGAKRGQTT